VYNIIVTIVCVGVLLLLKDTAKDILSYYMEPSKNVPQLKFSKINWGRVVEVSMVSTALSILVATPHTRLDYSGTNNILNLKWVFLGERHSNFLANISQYS